MNPFIKKLSVLIFLLLTLNISIFGQGGIWTWMKGDSTLYNGVQMGNYGIKGVSSPTNEPPGRYHPNYWTDKQGNFWLSNGQILNIGPLNDLWKYDLSTNEWTWMNGPQIITNTAGIFGTQGVPSPNNYPPSGGLSGYCWSDDNNNLWQYHSFGDVWKYNITTNEWTWMKGLGITLQAPVFGIQGLPNAANTPGYHIESKCSWTDANNNFWLYLDGDMWMYDIATNMWTWMKGPGTGFPMANYGIQGVASVTNQPSMTQAWTYWKDKNGKFILGYNAYFSSAIWSFDPLTNMWTWLGGITTIPQGSKGGTYISQCTPSVDRKPNRRIESRGASYSDQNLCKDFLWFCGGSSFGHYNDLWVYEPGPNTWNWISGDSAVGALGKYGTKGVPAASNMLPCRQGHAMWVDSLQQVWIFGGLVRGNVSRGNDLWRFTPDPSCLGFVFDTFMLKPPLDTLLCFGESTLMTLDPSYSIVFNPSNNVTPNLDTSVLSFSPLITTTYTITASRLVNNCPSFKSISFTIYVRDFKMPPLGDTSLCEGQGCFLPMDTSYQFSFLPNALQYNAGDSKAYFKPTTTTTYTVTATKDGCKVSDTGYFKIIIYPNPIADFRINPEVTDISHSQFELINQSLNATTYQWFVHQQMIATTQHTSYTAMDTGKICFTLLAFDQLGCSDSLTSCGEVLPDFHIIIPNVFSPNDDGRNDVFRIVSKNIHLKTFVIYNRWGQELFKTDNIKLGWNGMFKGIKSEVGVYFYYIEYTNLLGKQYIKKGDVNLVR